MSDEEEEQYRPITGAILRIIANRHDRRAPETVTEGPGRIVSNVCVVLGLFMISRLLRNYWYCLKKCVKCNTKLSSVVPRADDSHGAPCPAIHTEKRVPCPILYPSSSHICTADGKHRHACVPTTRLSPP